MKRYSLRIRPKAWALDVLQHLRIPLKNHAQGSRKHRSTPEQLWPVSRCVLIFRDQDLGRAALPRVLLLTSFASLLLGGTSHPWWRSRGIIHAPRARSLGSSRPRTPSDLGRAASARSESLRCFCKAVGVIRQRTCPRRLPGSKRRAETRISIKGPLQSPP